VKNQQILIAKFISTDFISQNRTLNPVPEPMQGNGETEVARVYIGSSQETTRQHDIQKRDEGKAGIEKMHQRK
jgi:hypothetical protein